MRLHPRVKGGPLTNCNCLLRRQSYSTHTARGYRWNNRFRYKSFVTNKITPFSPLLEYRFSQQLTRTKKRGIKFVAYSIVKEDLVIYLYSLDFYFKLKEYTIKLSDSRFESRHSFIEEIGRTCLGASRSPYEWQTNL